MKLFTLLLPPSLLPLLSLPPLATAIPATTLQPLHPSKIFTRQFACYTWACDLPNYRPFRQNLAKGACPNVCGKCYHAGSGGHWFCSEKDDPEPPDAQGDGGMGPGLCGNAAGAGSGFGMEDSGSFQYNKPDCKISQKYGYVGGLSGGWGRLRVVKRFWSAFGAGG